MRTDITRAMMGNAAGLDKVTLAQLISCFSVTERTREIGIRRAVGAQSSAVMQQVLLEAVMLSVGGGLLGIALGLFASAFVARIVYWSTDISWIAIAASFAISATVGILFGYYPAQQASRVTPMTSLRYE